MNSKAKDDKISRLYSSKKESDNANHLKPTKGSYPTYVKNRMF